MVKQLWAQFVHRFSEILHRCLRILPKFSGIFNKSKLLGVHLHPLHPRLLHHWIDTSNVFLLITGNKLTTTQLIGGGDTTNFTFHFCQLTRITLRLWQRNVSILESHM